MLSASDTTINIKNQNSDQNNNHTDEAAAVDENDDVDESEDVNQNDLAEDGIMEITKAASLESTTASSTAAASAAAASPGAFPGDHCERVDDTDSGVKIITLNEAFSTTEISSRELYVRECIQVIFESMNTVRESATEDRPNVNAAVIGQPGIGKSCSLYYFAYMFLQKEDVKLVVILDDEGSKLRVFCNDKDEKLKGVHKAPNYLLLGQVQEKLNQLRESAILLVDMDKNKNPFDRLVHDEGLTVFTSSPGPFKRWLARMRHKLRLQLYSPPPLTKLETKAVYGSMKAKFHLDMEEFEDYFDVFGGTIRPMRGAGLEFERMVKGSLKLLNIDPATIVTVVQRGVEEEGEDFTHALFADPGGEKKNSYQVTSLSPTRVFRSKFSEFWFCQYVAPRILFTKYSADILSVLYNANKVANGGARGCEFEDLFHKLIVLGNWKTETLPEEQGGSHWSFLAGFLHTFYTNPSRKSDSKKLALMNVPVVQRGENETEEADLDSRWNKKFGGKKQDAKGSTTSEAQKIDNRRDVAKFIAACKEKNEFYWLPLGPRFPGLDSVHKNASSLNFFQVKTGKVAEGTHKWIDQAIYFSQLLFNLMPNDDKDQLDVTIIVGTEPAREPLLKKPKLEKLNIPKNWSIRYLSAPVNGTGPKQLNLDMTRYKDGLKAEFLTFKARQQILEQSTKGQGDKDTAEVETDKETRHGGGRNGQGDKTRRRSKRTRKERKQ